MHPALKEKVEKTLAILKVRRAAVVLITARYEATLHLLPITSTSMYFVCDKSGERIVKNIGIHRSELVDLFKTFGQFYFGEEVEVIEALVEYKEWQESA
jgi:hypothetical protein